MPRSSHHSQFLENVGSRVAELRRARGMTQSTLAEVLGLETQTVQRIERGKVSMALPRLADLAMALGVPPHVLLMVPGEPSPMGPEDTMSTEERALLFLWRDVPEAQRDLLRRVLEQFRPR